MVFIALPEAEENPSADGPGRPSKVDRSKVRGII